MTRITAMMIAGNYPEHTKILGVTGHDGQWGAVLYMMKEGNIHSMLVSTDPVFPTKEEAEVALDKAAQQIKAWVDGGMKEVETQ